MKIPLLPETDLANFATLPPDQRRDALRRFKASGSAISYRPLYQRYFDIFNAQPELFGRALPTELPRILDLIRRASKSDAEERANIPPAECLHAFAVEEQVRAKRHEIVPFTLTGVAGVSLTYWLPLIFIIGDRLVVPFIDPRRSHTLSAEGRRFAFSMAHQRARVLDPDLGEAELLILQLPSVKTGVRGADGKEIEQRQLRRRWVSELDAPLFGYDELDAMVAETYAAWQEVLVEREEDTRRRAGGPGGLFGSP